VGGELASKKVLILHSNNAFIPANRIVDGAIVPVLNAAGIPTSSIYSEYLDHRRFRDSRVLEDYIRYLRGFYSSLKIDLVIINEESYSQFCGQVRAEVSSDVPVVLCAVSAGAVIPDFLKGRVTGSLKNMDARGSIRGIMTLQPAVREIAVLVGFGRAGRLFRRDHAKGAGRKSSVCQDFHDEGQAAAGAPHHDPGLGPGSALLALSFFRDSAGGVYNPRDVVDMVVRRSPVPVYGISDTYLDTGFVGGNLMSFRDLGADAATGPFMFSGESLYLNRP
jgi:hypothetical protein